MLYQSANFRNAVFVGYDGDMPAYAFKRNIFKDFKLEHTGSNKAFSFNYQNKESNVLHVFEAAIDLLSYMTLLKAANHFIDSVENGKFVLINSAKSFQLCLNPRLRSNSYESS